MDQHEDFDDSDENNMEVSSILKQVLQELIQDEIEDDLSNYLKPNEWARECNYAFNTKFFSEDSELLEQFGQIENIKNDIQQAFDELLFLLGDNKIIEKVLKKV